MSSNPNNLLSF